MAAWLRPLALGALGALLLLLWGTSSERASAVEAGAQRWRIETRYWLGVAPARAALRVARQPTSTPVSGRPALSGSVIGQPARVHGSLGLMQLRTVSLGYWALLLAPLWAAALVDGWTSREGDPLHADMRPERSTAAASGLRSLAMSVPALLAWPGPLPELLVPGMGVAAALLLRVWARHCGGGLR